MGGYTAKGKGLPLAGCLRIAANEQGFVQAGYCCLSSSELKPNKEIKVQDNN
mgnify:CR=1 FL=1